MLLAIWALLSAVQLAGTSTAPENKISCAFSNEVLRNLTLKVDQLDWASENLRLKMDTLNLIINQQFLELKTATETGKPDNSNNDQQCGSYGHLIDVRANLEDKPIWPSPCPFSSFTPASRLPTSCADAMHKSGRGNGVYKINIPESTLAPFFVYCEADPKHVGAAWTIVQRRQDGAINFYRDWAEYRYGFGNLEGEFFLGLDKLHALTQSTLHELWIQLEDFENVRRWAKYSSFAVGSANESYVLNVLGTYMGDAGDSLVVHAGQKFTTPDVDNDQHELQNCAVEYTGGWWYKKCHESNLNGQYLRGVFPADKFGKGVIWYKFREHYYSLKYVHMAIRPVSLGK